MLQVLLSDGSVQKPVELPTRLSLLTLFDEYERTLGTYWLTLDPRATLLNCTTTESG